MKKLNINIVLVLIILGIGTLAYTSYLAGYKASKNDMDTLLMTMTIDSNFVTAGLYEELPNSVRKSLSFYIEDTPTLVNDIKLFAEVKYATIGGEIIDTDDGRIWQLVKRDKVFERKFDDKNSNDNLEQVPDSPFAYNLIKN